MGTGQNRISWAEDSLAAAFPGRGCGEDMKGGAGLMPSPVPTVKAFEERLLPMMVKLSMD